MFRTRLRELREQAGYGSQQSFADAFGVAQSTVGGWEAGKREPNYSTTLKIAHFFGVSIDYLLGRADQKEGPTPVAGDGPLYPPEYDLLSQKDKDIVNDLIRSLAKKQSAD